MAANDYRARLLASLNRRGLLAPADAAGAAPMTIYGQPAWRSIPPGHEPQPLMEGTRRQRDLVVSAHATPPTAPDQCAAWVELVFARLGIGRVTGDASGLYHSWCHEADTRGLLVGMIVATPSHPYGCGGRSWGHVGLYAGDGSVMHCNDGKVLTAPLELWISAYGVMAEPRWGWLGGIALD